jgi:hypothetical protein
MTEHLERARESAQHTYDRRRARKAADTLATILPSRWDDETRRIIGTLATISAPSRIDDLLVDAFEPPIGGAEPVALCGSMHGHDSIDEAKACDDLPRARAADEAELDEREHVANGVVYAAGDDLLVPLEVRPYFPRPCVVPCGAADCDVVCSRMHDNGDYRA